MAAFLAVGVAASHTATPLAPLPAIAIPTGNLQSGDLIFRRGRDLMSGIVLAQKEGAHYSHVGVIVREGADVFVVHAIPADGTAPLSGVVKEPLQAFAAGDLASAIAIYRAPLAAAQRAAVQAYALRQVGKPFDTGFAMSDDASLYCTELAVKALHAGGQRLLELQTLTVGVIAEPVIAPDALAAHRSLTLVTATGA
jgi:uncharacterized protein YycO